jgi:hypothetical protein
MYIQVIYEDAAEAGLEYVLGRELVRGWMAEGDEGGEEHWGAAKKGLRSSGAEKRPRKDWRCEA